MSSASGSFGVPRITEGARASFFSGAERLFGRASIRAPTFFSFSSRFAIPVSFLGTERTICSSFGAFGSMRFFECWAGFTGPLSSSLGRRGLFSIGFFGVQVLRNLLGQIILDAYGSDDLYLGLEPVDMLLLGNEDLLEQFTGAVVFILSCDFNSPVQTLHGVIFYV